MFGYCEYNCVTNSPRCWQRYCWNYSLTMPVMTIITDHYSDVIWATWRLKSSARIHPWSASLAFCPPVSSGFTSQCARDSERSIHIHIFSSNVNLFWLTFWIWTSMINCDYGFVFLGLRFDDDRALMICICVYLRHRIDIPSFFTIIFYANGALLSSMCI